jgi:hypothetical protein
VTRIISRCEKDLITVRCRPISTFPKAETPDWKRKRSQFRSQWGVTLDELRHELAHLRAKDVVLELDIREDEIRIRDGWPKSSARPRSPRVVLSFTIPDVGGVRYPCDTFDDWGDNVRAIALALEALRSVDRYGVTTKHEQYAGWKALPGSTVTVMTTMEAAEVLAAHQTFATANDILRGHNIARDAYLRAVKRAHPDMPTGSAKDFQAVQNAKMVLSGHFGVSL